MRNIILLFIPLVLLGCQREYMPMEEYAMACNSSRASPGYSLEKFNRFYRPCVGGVQGCRAFTPEERNDFFWTIVEMGGFYPAMAKIIDSLDYLGVSVICGINENLTGDDAGYYDPALGQMFFKAKKIDLVPVQHEFLHIAQHRILGYDMI